MEEAKFVIHKSKSRAIGFAARFQSDALYRSSVSNVRRVQLHLSDAARRRR